MTNNCVLVGGVLLVETAGLPMMLESDDLEADA